MVRLRVPAQGAPPPPRPEAVRDLANKVLFVRNILSCKSLIRWRRSR